MIEAMKAVEDKKMTLRGAAKKFSVPYSTLKDRVHGRVRHGAKPGVKTALSPEEEEELVRYVRVCRTCFPSNRDTPFCQMLVTISCISSLERCPLVRGSIRWICSTYCQDLYPLYHVYREGVFSGQSAL